MITDLKRKTVEKENENNINTQEAALLPVVSSESLLSSINSPEDLRKIPQDCLPALCAEIRQYLIDNLSKNPGHFGSSMGAVDLIVALHYVFNTPDDRIVWDVGHQAYAHKILTGRKEEFKTQRTFGGISGFPNPNESRYDTFVCGHAGNSISAALGMAIADLNTPGQENRKTVAVIGDASIGNGLAFEGLNNASNNPNNLLIILNDNDMSIDDNVGALHRYLSDLTTSSRYNKLRMKLYNLLRKEGIIGDKGKGLMLRFNNSLKSLISKQQNIFEGLNIRYFGPFDGNDVNKLVKVLNDIKDMKGPRILHISTKKGKGFTPAEANPQSWHAPGVFDPVSGERKSKEGNLAWQDIFGMTLVEMAEKDSAICGVTAAMPSGTSMSMMQEAFPERTYDVGISEGHAVTFAGGMAAAGKRPFVAIYSSFLQRAYDNIIHDVAIQNLPVVFCIDRAGLVGEDGVTHHGVFDLCYLRNIPNITLASPMDGETLQRLMATASKTSSPFAIRYPRGKSDVRNLIHSPETLKIGEGRQVFASSIHTEKRVALLSVGPIGNEGITAAKKLEEEGIAVDVFDMIWVSPLDASLLNKISESYSVIVTLEDGAKDGGFGSAVLEWLADNGKKVRVERLGVPPEWIAHGSVAQLRKVCGFDAEGIIKCIKKETAL